MKKWFYFLVIITLLSSCQNVKQPLLVSESSIYMPKPILNDTIIKILDDYIKYTQYAPGIVYQIFVDYNRDSTMIYLAYTQFYDMLKIPIPSGYLINKNRLFVMYTGTSLLMKTDSVFLRKLNEEIHKYDLKTKNEMFSLIEYPYWAIAFYEGKSTYRIYKRRYLYDSKFIDDIKRF